MAGNKIRTLTIPNNTGIGFGVIVTTLNRFLMSGANKHREQLSDRRRKPLQRKELRRGGAFLS